MEWETLELSHNHWVLKDSCCLMLFQIYLPIKKSLLRFLRRKKEFMLTIVFSLHFSASFLIYFLLHANVGQTHSQEVVHPLSQKNLLRFLRRKPENPPLLNFFIQKFLNSPPFFVATPLMLMITMIKYIFLKLEVKVVMKNWFCYGLLDDFDKKNYLKWCNNYNDWLIG